MLAPALMDVAQWAVVVCAAVLGSLAQGATGFGSALVALPLMLWGNLSLPAAIAVSTALILLQGLNSCWPQRTTTSWKETNAMWRALQPFPSWRLVTSGECSLEPSGAAEACETCFINSRR